MYTLNAKHFGLDQKLTDLLTKFAEDNNYQGDFTVHSSPDGAYLHGQFEFRANAQAAPVEPEAPAVPRDPKVEPAAEGPAVISTVQATLIEQMLHNQLGIGANLFDSLKEDELLVTREHGDSQVLCLVEGLTTGPSGTVPMLNVKPVSLLSGKPVKYSKASPMDRVLLSSISGCWLPATIRGQKPVKGQQVAFRAVVRGKHQWLTSTVLNQRGDTVQAACASAGEPNLALELPVNECWTMVKAEKAADPTKPVKGPTKAEKRRSMKPGAK